MPSFKVNSYFLSNKGSLNQQAFLDQRGEVHILSETVSWQSGQEQGWGGEGCWV